MRLGVHTSNQQLEQQRRAGHTGTGTRKPEAVPVVGDATATPAAASWRGVARCAPAAPADTRKTTTHRAIHTSIDTPKNTRLPPVRALPTTRLIQRNAAPVSAASASPNALSSARTSRRPGRARGFAARQRSISATSAANTTRRAGSRVVPNDPRQFFTIDSCRFNNRPSVQRAHRSDARNADRRLTPAPVDKQPKVLEGPKERRLARQHFKHDAAEHEHVGLGNRHATSVRGADKALRRHPRSSRLAARKSRCMMCRPCKCSSADAPCRRMRTATSSRSV